MISIGTDIVEIARIKKSYKRFGESFLSHVYSKREQGLLTGKAQDVAFLAGRFAAKEAIYKALSANISYGIAWKDMEVLRGSSGNPYVELSGLAKTRADELGIKKTHISISHSKEFAIAFVTTE